jgi:hypothetical protein
MSTFGINWFEGDAEAKLTALLVRGKDASEWVQQKHHTMKDWPSGEILSTRSTHRQHDGMAR